MQEIWFILRTTAVNPPLLAQALLDIFLVAIPFYVLFSLLRESRSFIALWGIVTMLVLSILLYLAAKALDLQATALIYERFWMIVVLVFLILFQNDLKRGLADIGQTRFLRAFFVQEEHGLGEIIRAVQAMAERKVGCLIAIERSGSLKPYLATGTALDAEISHELLRSIFNTQSPLHDGAVAIRGPRVLAAACILPLTEDPRLSKELGTRHRAAIGLTEESDAVVVVVSEETGTISLVTGGKIERFLQPDDLRKRLERELNIQTSEGGGEGRG